MTAEFLAFWKFTCKDVGWAKFKSWTRLFTFHFTGMPLDCQSKGIPVKWNVHSVVQILKLKCVVKNK